MSKAIELAHRIEQGFTSIDLAHDIATELRRLDVVEKALAPVAWHTEDHLTDRSATTYDKNVMYRWQCKGWPITPLYALPETKP